MALNPHSIRPGRHKHQAFQREYPDQPPSLEDVLVINPAQQPADAPRHISAQDNHIDHSNHNEPNSLTLLAHTLERYATHGPSPGTPISAPPDRMAEPLNSALSGASFSGNPAQQSIDDAQQGGSYGTLMLSKRGRSKYLGPTAGSEWLKEASYLS